MRNADAIELVFETRYRDKEGVHGPRKLVAGDKKEIERIVASIELVDKHKCRCRHTQEIVLRKGEQEVNVSICSHCFDVIDTNGFIFDERVTHFKMPGDLYKIFQEYHDSYEENKE